MQTDSNSDHHQQHTNDDPPGGNTERACHVARIVLEGLSNRRPAVCSTLPSEVIASVSDYGATWRDNQHVARRLQELRDDMELGGIALWYQRSKAQVDPPAPLTVPFEPLLLDESASPLAELCGVAAPDRDVPRISPRWKRAAVRFGLPLAVVLPQVVNAIVQVAVQRSPFIVWLWGAMLVTMIGAGLLLWTLSDQWLLIPGGVIIRKSLFGKVGRSLTRYTPGDAVLIIRPMPPGHQAEVWRGQSVRGSRATQLEVIALLAAWQSPIPPPDLERCSDFE